MKDLTKFINSLEESNSLPDEQFMNKLEAKIVKHNSNKAFLNRMLASFSFDRRILFAGVLIFTVIFILIAVPLLPFNNLSNEVIISKVLAANPGSITGSRVSDYTLSIVDQKFINGPKYSTCRPDVYLYGLASESKDMNYYLNNTNVLSSSAYYSADGTLIDYDLFNLGGMYLYSGGNYIVKFGEDFKTINDLKNLTSLPDGQKSPDNNFNFNNIKNLDQTGNYYKLVLQEVVKCGQDTLPKITIMKINKDTFKIEDKSEYIYSESPENLIQEIQISNQIKALSIENAVEMFKLNINKPVKNYVKEVVTYNDSKGFEDNLKNNNIDFLLPVSKEATVNGFDGLGNPDLKYTNDRAFYPAGSLGDKLFQDILNDKLPYLASYEILLNGNYYTFIDIKAYPVNTSMDKILDGLVYKELDPKSVNVDNQSIEGRMFQYEYVTLDGSSVGDNQIVIDGNSDQKCGNVSCFKKTEYLLVFKFHNLLYSLHLYLPNVLEENNTIFKSYNPNKVSDYNHIQEIINNSLNLPSSLIQYLKQ